MEDSARGAFVIPFLWACYGSLVWAVIDVYSSSVVLFSIFTRASPKSTQNYLLVANNVEGE